MSVKSVIAKRRSIRKYQRKKVSDSLIMELIEAARLAPSGNNAQPARYAIVKDEDIKAKLKEANIFHQDFVYEAPVIIVCCGDPKAYPRQKVKSGLDDSFESRAGRDVAIAAQTLVLRATELGLGSCYIGWMDKNKVRKVLDIPKGYVIPFAVTLGYPDEKPEARPRKSVKELIL